jgi:hypothetical protein
MTASLQNKWLASSQRNPCPICGRTKDGDCRTSPDGLGVLCHYGQSHSPPDGLKPGDVITRKDSQSWAFTGNATDGRTAHFTFDKTMKGTGGKVNPFHTTVEAQPNFRKPASISGPIALARCEPVAFDPDCRKWRYSPSQGTKRIDKPGGKAFIPYHLDQEEWRSGAGPNPWPAYMEGEAVEGFWLLELEGEKCADLARSGGRVAISQPGHAHKPEQIRTRYARLKCSGVAGVVYLADHDKTGQRRSEDAAEVAAEVGFPLLVLHANEVWPGLSAGGSIDDAPGTVADRIAAVELAIEVALNKPEPHEANTRKEKKDDLELIRATATRIVSENPDFNRSQYIHRLRELVEPDLTVQARDELYRREIGEAIIRRDGLETHPFIGGCQLPDESEAWIVEAVILAGTLNILGADPKAGKTLWAVALIASLLHGCQQFIGRGIKGHPPNVIIVGPDQPIRLWKKQLQAVGLVQGNTLDERIVRLWDSQNPWAATPEGLSELRRLCADYPGSLVLVDSFAKVSEKLGIEENSREAAEVLSDIERACIFSGCTPLVIHHNAKAAGRSGIVNGGALRGNSAIRANASQVAVLTLIDQDNPKDPRRRLVTEGRGGEFIDAVIQLEEDGWSWRHVCDFSEHRKAATVERSRARLSPAQQEVLDAVEGSQERLTTAQVWAVLHPYLPWEAQTTDAKALSQTLARLVEKGLLARQPGTANRPTFSSLRIKS